VLARHVRNKRLADAIYLWAFASLTASPGARAFYDQRRAAGDTHHQALRALGHLVGSSRAAWPTTRPTASTPPAPTASTSEMPAPLDTYSRGMSRPTRSRRSTQLPGTALKAADADLRPKRGDA
jgi:hypothetical protein